MLLFLCFFDCICNTQKWSKGKKKIWITGNWYNILCSCSSDFFCLSFSFICIIYFFNHMVKYFIQLVSIFWYRHTNRMKMNPFLTSPHFCALTIVIFINIYYLELLNYVTENCGVVENFQTFIFYFCCFCVSTFPHCSFKLFIFANGMSVRFKFV